MKDNIAEDLCLKTKFFIS